MAELKLDGLGVALVTPFNKDFSIDYESLEKLIDYVIEGGCDYLVALGTTGEPPTLSLEEKEKLSRFIKIKNAGRIPLIIGIGGNCTEKVVDDIKRLDLNGYSAILSVTPYYNKPNQEGLFQHYRTISDVSPLPIILYNVPGRTGVNLNAETTLRLATYSNKFIGVKEASGNIFQAEEIMRKAPINFKVISGDDAAIFSLMRKGACGVISVLANVFPNKVKQLVELCQKQNYMEAEALQDNLLPLISSLFEDGNPGGVKALLERMGLIKNILRLPLVPVKKETAEKLIKEAENLHLLND